MYPLPPDEVQQFQYGTRGIYRFKSVESFLQSWLCEIKQENIVFNTVSCKLLHILMSILIMLQKLKQFMQVLLEKTYQVKKKKMPKGVALRVIVFAR